MAGGVVGQRERDKNVAEICQEFDRVRFLTSKVETLTKENEALKQKLEEQMQLNSKQDWILQQQLHEALDREQRAEARHRQEVCVKKPCCSYDHQ